MGAMNNVANRTLRNATCARDTPMSVIPPPPAKPRTPEDENAGKPGVLQPCHVSLPVGHGSIFCPVRISASRIQSNTRFSCAATLHARPTCGRPEQPSRCPGTCGGSERSAVTDNDERRFRRSGGLRKRRRWSANRADQMS
jgi:hypothetical protein